MITTKRELCRALVVGCILGFGTIADATPPEPVRVPVGTIEPWPQNREEIISWFRVHGEQIAERLRDEERLKHRGRGAAQGQLLFEQIRLVSLKPPRIEFADPEPLPDDPRIVERIQMAYQVAVPNVREGQAWVAKNGRVVVGYRHPLPDLHVSQMDEDILDGKRVTRSRSYDSTGRSEQMAPSEQPQFGDLPVMAYDLLLYIGENGRVYF